MELKIALAGNPNCGKTTLFNALTGSSQYVGNWPGVTVEKKEGKLKGHKDVVIQDLPGIYSLSPYTLEEVVARNYLVNEKPDAILNIVDGTNIERNLYLTTQLIELGIPVVVAVNMIDLVRKNGDVIDLQKLGAALGCQVVEMSALKGEGGKEAAERAVALAKSKRGGELPHVFTGSVEHAIAHIEESIADLVEERYLRWYAIKVFERDEKVLAALNLTGELKEHLEAHIADCERELDDDAESIITNQRYSYISSVVGKAVKKKQAAHAMTTSDKIDRVVTNRILALPIFVAVMILVYAIAMGGSAFALGTKATEWANDGLFGDGWFVPFTADTEAWEEASGAWEEASAMIAGYEAGDSEVYFYDDETGETTVVPVTEEAYQQALTVPEPDPNAYGTWVPGLPVLAEEALTSWNTHPVVQSLVLDGIIGGVGAVLGFVPQMLVLFLLLALLEDCGYMARIAFIMDRIFRRFGLSGKSFIPMLVATGCGVPGIMASRTIEQERDRRMTIMTTGFIPCGAKMPIIALFAGALFGGSAWVATSAYFIGVAAVVISGIILKKTRGFAGDPAPFVMELPAYHAPAAGNVLRAMWERGWSFIKRAGTVILRHPVVPPGLRLCGRRVPDGGGQQRLPAGRCGPRCVLYLRAPGLRLLGGHRGGGHRPHRQGGGCFYLRRALPGQPDRGYGCRLHRHFRLLLHDLQPAVRPLLRRHGRHQAGDEQPQVDPGRHRLYVRLCLCDLPHRLPDRRTHSGPGGLWRGHRGCPHLPGGPHLPAGAQEQV